MDKRKIHCGNCGGALPDECTCTRRGEPIAPEWISGNGWYYLIHLGRDIARCPGNQTRANLHLAQLRRDVVEEHRQATGRDPEKVPWLIGVYPPNAVGGPEGKGGVFSYGYAPTLLGNINVPRARWHRLI